MIKPVLIGVCSLLLLPVLVIAAASGGISTSTPTPQALTDIPPQYLLLYGQAGLAFHVPWPVLAGIGKVECDHGQNPDPACWREGVENSAGAGGPMQFLATTWQSYGIDANGDGTADRWDPADAIVSAANYLRANGAPENISAAVYAYNHSHSYVAEVLAWAQLYAGDTGSSDSAPSAAGMTVPPAQTAVAYALSQLGTPYVWAGEDPGVGFDCSGLMQAAYAAAGIQLPRVAQDQYDATTPLPTGAAIAPGDLVFFGADLAHIDHVGIVVSPGEMVDAPHTGAVVRVEPYSWPDFIAATRPAGAKP